MDDKAITEIVYVLSAVLGLAIIAELVSQQSNTVSVFGAFGKSIQTMICTALSPVTGKSCGTLTESVSSRVIFGS